MCTYETGWSSILALKESNSPLRGEASTSFTFVTLYLRILKYVFTQQKHQLLSREASTGLSTISLNGDLLSVPVGDLVLG